MVSLKYKPSSKKEGKATILLPKTSQAEASTETKAIFEALENDTKIVSGRDTKSEFAANVLRAVSMSSFPFQYWQINDKEVADKCMMDLALEGDYSTQQLKHLERTSERAQFYASLKKFEENSASNRNTGGQSTKHPSVKPTPPLSKYALL